MTIREQRAAQYRDQACPNGEARSQPFQAEMRAETVIWNDRESTKLTGLASATEKRYPMWDMFGEYDEVIDQKAFDETLRKKPDVAFLVNHRGLSMARTTNDTLFLSVTSKGLEHEAYLNPKRSDVADLLLAVEDGDITEESFAFRIIDGEWNDDFSEFRILEVDLNRGDVSAVNYGANPYTSVTARQTEVMEDFRRLPEGARRAALAEVEVVEHPWSKDAEQGRPAAEVTATTVEVEQKLKQGRSVDLVSQLFELI